MLFGLDLPPGIRTFMFVNGVWIVFVAAARRKRIARGDQTWRSGGVGPDFEASRMSHVPPSWLAVLGYALIAAAFVL